MSTKTQQPFFVNFFQVKLYCLKFRWCCRGHPKNPLAPRAVAPAPECESLGRIPAAQAGTHTVPGNQSEPFHFLSGRERAGKGFGCAALALFPFSSVWGNGWDSQRVVCSAEDLAAFDERLRELSHERARRQRADPAARAQAIRQQREDLELRD